MSAAEHRTDHEDLHEDLDEASSHGPSLSVAADVVEVRRNAGVAAAVGALASGVAIAYLARAASTGSWLDWALVVVMGLLGVAWLSGFVDARTPLMVADSQGVRIRLGRTWRGLPWSAVERVEHTPRQGLLRDGRLNVVPRNTELLLEELDRSGARQARWSTRLYGGPLALPLGLTTRVSGGDGDVSLALERLVDRGAEVVVLDDHEDLAELVAEPVDGDQADDDHDSRVGAHDHVVADDADADGTGVQATARGRLRLRDPRPLLAGGLARVSAMVPARTSSAAAPDEDDRDHQDQGLDQGLDHDLEQGLEQDLDQGLEQDLDHDLEQDLDQDLDPEPSETPEPARETTIATRAEVRHTTPESETEVLPRAGVELVEDDEVWGDRVRPISRAGHPVAPLVLDDFAAEPAADPVVGPELRAARTRLRLSVDQLAERTRIRPHVIESIEVDDFVPCGGDFYARGHLRTLARVLGVDVAPLLAAYDERYAHAPIDPRRVFEAELATGAQGSIRGTRGGPNWSILVAAVMALVLAWSIARLVMDAPPELRGTPVLNGSGGPHGGSAVVADPVPVAVTAPSGGAQVVVRDSSGAVVFKGNLAIGETKTVEASPPVRVQTSDGSVVVVVDGADRGPVGEAGTAVQGTYAAD